MVIDIEKERKRIYSILETRYLEGSKYVLFNIDLDNEIIYLDYLKNVESRPAFLPFKLEDYRIKLF